MMEDLDVLNDLDQLESRYDVLRHLGYDGESLVYAVVNPTSKLHFAVSVVSDSGGRSGSPGALQLWQAHTIEPLLHPKLMDVHTVHHLQGGAVAVAMARRRGITLAERLVTDGSLPVAEAEEILRDIAEALAYLHSRGVVHRGVRPETIFLDRDSGHARLAPFGIDTADTGQSDEAGCRAAARRSGYLAPEQIGGSQRIGRRRITPRTDLYSLGLVGLAMLGDGGSTDAGLAKLEDRATPTGEQGGVPEYLVHALVGCLQKNPRHRWTRAEEFMMQLGAAGDPDQLPARSAWSPLREYLEAGLGRLTRVSLPNLPTSGGARLAFPAALLIAVSSIALLRGNEEASVQTGDSVPASASAAESPSAQIIPAVVPDSGSASAPRMPDFAGHSIMQETDSELPANRAADPGSPEEIEGRREPAAPTPDRQPRQRPEPDRPSSYVLLGDPVGP